MRADELPLWERTLIATYPWRRVQPLPVATLAKPVEACRVALVTTAGLVPRGSDPFDLRKRGGDTSFRVIPADASVLSLSLVHRSEAFERAAVETDPNVAFPLDRLRELAERGEVGAVAPRHLSFMGSITAPGRLVKDSAARAARLLVEDGVNIALLAPV